MSRFGRRLTTFVVVAIAFEILALALIHGSTTKWVVTGIIVLFVLYLAGLAVRGLRRQTHIDYPAVMTGRVVRSRHWRLF